MLTRIGDMRSREVISVRDGARIGYLGDIEIDTASASLAAIVVYGRSRAFWAVRPRTDCVIPWSDITTIGEDADGRLRGAQARPKAQLSRELF